MNRIAIFASGKGSNAEALCTHFSNHPDYKIELILCDRLDAGVYDVARNFKVPVISITRGFNDGKYLTAVLKENKIDFVLLAGYLRLVPSEVIAAYENKILNIHPALLPDFGGKGMYGEKVHAAVIAADKSETGFTIHIVNAVYDEGKIIFQEKIKVPQGISASDLQMLVNKEEHRLYPAIAEKYFDSVNQKS